MSNEVAAKGTLWSYTAGFVLSLATTLGAYLVVNRHVNSHHEEISHKTITITIVTLAITQLIVQLVFFLHLGRGSNRKWNLTVFAFMLTVLVILVGGSLWIMNNLNYHMNDAHSDNQYIIKDEGIH